MFEFTNLFNVLKLLVDHYYYYYYYFLSFFLSCYSDDPSRVPGTRKTARGELQKPDIEPWTAVPKGADLQIHLTAGLVRHRMQNTAKSMWYRISSSGKRQKQVFCN